MKNYFDTIVIGLGALGVSTLFQLSKFNGSILGIDQYTSPNTFSSHGGDSRITRQAIAEGEEYVDLVLRSNEIWKEIEKETNQKILYQIGALFISSENSETSDNFF